MSLDLDSMATLGFDVVCALNTGFPREGRAQERGRRGR